MYRTLASLWPDLLKGLPGASATLPHMPPPLGRPQPMFSAACRYKDALEREFLLPFSGSLRLQRCQIGMLSVLIDTASSRCDAAGALQNVLWLLCSRYLAQRLDDHVEAGEEHDGVVHNAEALDVDGFPLAHEPLPNIHSDDVCVSMT